MPLHLLGKKSWHVYNAANVARVRRDEAAAALVEEEREKQMQVEDAERRTRLLRGEVVEDLKPVGSLVPGEDGKAAEESLDGRDEDSRRCVVDRASTRQQDGQHRKPELGDGDGYGALLKLDRRRKRRRYNEDDTDRDLRLAREDMATREEARERASDGIDGFGLVQRTTTTEDRGRSEGQGGDVSLVDERGHISLFPAPLEQREAKHRPKAKTSSKDNTDSTVDGEEVGMRFSDAAGYGKRVRAPWYAGASSSASNDGSTTLPQNKPRHDGAKHARSKHHTSNSNSRPPLTSATADPMAAMAAAQAQLKQAARDRDTWVAQRAKEVDDMLPTRSEDRDSNRASGPRQMKRHKVEKKEEGHRHPYGERDWYRKASKANTKHRHSRLHDSLDDDDDDDNDLSDLEIEASGEERRRESGDEGRRRTSKRSPSRDRDGRRHRRRSRSRTRYR